MSDTITAEKIIYDLHFKCFVLEARCKSLAQALESIAGNSCCHGCQEAKKVAAAALTDNGGRR